ncbi:MAG: RagB/SusD family nutrient uptake outer membrane protein [Gemmatimonadota bacterium]
MTILQQSAKRVTRMGLAALVVVGLAGCKDFLGTKPQGELTTANFFQNEQQAIEATNATYSMLRDWEVHVFSWLGVTDIVSDDATKGSVPGDASFLGELDNLNFDPGNIAFHDTWQGYYRGIYRANVAIQGIPSANMDANLKARLIGENKFLRAYYYFFLVRAYGGVPLITKPLLPSQFTQPRATAQEVYAQIEKDLTDAMGVLPLQYSGADIGRATKGAAQALLAKVDLYEKKYQDALNNAEAVINSGQYSLYPDYDTLFTQAAENSSESVFEVGNVALPQGGGASQYAQVQGVRGTPNIGWGFNDPSPNLEASYEPGDPRLEATILYPWELLPDGSLQVVYLNPSMLNNRYNQKAFTPPAPGNAGQGSNNSGVDIRIIRYADVLLFAAEAAYRTGDEAKARTYLNMVRARARGTRTVTLGISPETLSDSVAAVAGLPANGSRVFIRYVNPTTQAYAAGLRSMATEYNDANAPPVQVDTMDVINTVDGTAVTTLQDYFTQVDTKTPGNTVALGITRVTTAGPTNLTVNVPAMALLPDVTATGQDLLTAIWHERRHELAMEQHRWFDINRQGRADALMTADGKSWAAQDSVYPIPSAEVQLVGLQQNPGYGS